MADMRNGDGNGNIFVRNYGVNPAPAFNFMLRVEGVIDVPCKKIIAFHKENEFEYIQEGGLNDYVHMRRKPISQPFKLQVERYIGVDFLDPLTLGTELILPLFLMVGRNLVYDEFDPVRLYLFTGCVVTDKQWGDLDAERSSLFTEIVTIGYREMFCIQNPLNGE